MSSPLATWLDPSHQAVQGLPQAIPFPSLATRLYAFLLAYFSCCLSLVHPMLPIGYARSEWSQFSPCKTWPMLTGTLGIVVVADGWTVVWGGKGVIEGTGKHRAWACIVGGIWGSCRSLMWVPILHVIPSCFFPTRMYLPYFWLFKTLECVTTRLWGLVLDLTTSCLMFFMFHLPGQVFICFGCIMLHSHPSPLSNLSWFLSSALALQQPSLLSQVKISFN